jgi:hypothetical protein
MRPMRTRLLVCLVLMPASAASIFSGCGGAQDELPRQTVAGTVKFQGGPLKSGLIQFQPSSAGASMAGGAGIVDGQYSISRAEGLVPGSYQVSITSAAAAASPAGALPGDSPPPAREPIPVKYNARTTLKAEVKPDAPNKFDYDLDSK